jgi:hypothetical protein
VLTVSTLARHEEIVNTLFHDFTPMTTSLDYLIFDYSEDDEGTATWDAMATVHAERLPALEQEVLQVLGWAEQQFPQQRGAIDEGATWDFDLSASDAAGHAVALEVDLRALSLRHPPMADGDLLTLALTLTGRGAFADAFVQRFAVE